MSYLYRVESIEVTANGVIEIVNSNEVGKTLEGVRSFDLTIIRF